MRLTPMLEIQIPDNGNPAVPSIATLQAYSRTLQTAAATMTDLTDDGTPDGNLIGKAIYVPLSLVNDSDTGERVAFAGQLPLLTDESWGTDYQLRVVWTVQMLIDSCDQRYESGENAGQCEIYGARNVPVPIHTYDEQFYVTGLNIREDIATKSAIIYEDPTIDNDLTSDDQLWITSWFLSNTFLRGRDADENGERDVQISTLASNFASWHNAAAGPLCDHVGFAECRT